MKKYNAILEYSIILLIVLICPYIVYRLYISDFNINELIMKKLSSGDLLLYCGTILSAIIAWRAVKKTMMYTQK